MKLLALADIHGNFHNIPLLAEHAADSDGIVIAGDITDFSGKEQAKQVLEVISRLQKPVLAVPGNCDLPAVDDCLSRQNSNLHGNLISMNGVDFIGAGGSLSSPASEMVFENILNEAIYSRTESNDLVLVTHQPAWGIKQDARAGRHTGSQAIRQFIEQNRPVLAISGHIHEASGVDYLGVTTLVNPGPFRQCSYAIIELNSGTVSVEMKQL